MRLNIFQMRQTYDKTTKILLQSNYWSITLILGLFFLFVLNFSDTAFSQEIPEDFFKQIQLYDNNMGNDELTISLNKFFYKPGESAIFNGYVESHSPGIKLFISLKDSEGVLLRNENISVTNSGTFQLHTTIPNDIEPGVYRVVANYGGSGTPVTISFTINKDSNEFTIKIPPKSYLIEEGQSFIPDMVIIESGNTINWINLDSTVHTVVSGKRGIGNKMFSTGIFDSGTFGPGDKFSIILREEGDYDYFCKLHPWLTGFISVLPSSKPQEEIILEPLENDNKTKSEILEITEENSNWNVISCLDCNSSIVETQDDKKSGSSSTKLSVIGNKDSRGTGSTFVLEFNQNLSVNTNLSFWIKTTGNSDNPSRLIMKDPSFNNHTLLEFNSFSFLDWTQIILPLPQEEFIVDKYIFSFRAPDGELMKNKQLAILIDNLQFIEYPEEESVEFLKPFKIITDKITYGYTENVVVSGYVTNIEGDSPVTILVKDPKNNILSVEQISLNSDGTFGFIIPLAGKSFQQIGQYSITAQYGFLENQEKILFKTSPLNLIDESFNDFKIYNLGDNIFFGIPNDQEINISSLTSSRDITLPKFHFEFENEVIDSISGEFSPQLIGTNNFDEGKFGNGLLLIDNDAYIDFEESKQFISEHGSISGWIKYDDSGIYSPIISSFENANNRFEIAISKDNKLTFTIGTGDEWILLSSQTLVNKNNWNHFTVTYDKDRITLYVNGEQENSKKINGDIKIGSSNLNLGKRPGTNFYYNGYLDSIKFFEQVLTPNQIKLLYLVNSIIESKTILSDQQSNVIVSNSLTELRNTINLLNSIKISIESNPESFPVSDKILKEIWDESEVLQRVYPEVLDGNFTKFMNWAKYSGWKTEPKLFELIPPGQTPEYVTDLEDEIPYYQVLIIMISLGIAGYFGFTIIRKKNKITT